MRVFFAAIAALVTVSCATPYQQSGFTGGVQALPIGRDTYRVEAALNAYSSQSMVQDYLLLRAAETAQSNGAVGFVIHGAQDTSTTGRVVVPGQATTNAYAYGAGNYAYGQATTTYTPAQAYNFIRPGGMMMITLVREPVPAGLQYFSASEIIAAIGPRVRRAN
ncbi:MAG: hypothetical protein AB7H66_15640 [Hyphomonadaceae bacterium]